MVRETGDENLMPAYYSDMRALIPERGTRNVGMYSGYFLAPDRLLAGIARTHHAMLHHYPCPVFFQ
jgi:hypothetical protein